MGPPATLPLAGVVTIEELARNVEADKARAVGAIAKARSALGSLTEIEFTPDITGNPNASSYKEFKRDQRRGLEAASRSPFYYRVDTDRTMFGTTEPVRLLLSKARDMGSLVEGDDWQVVSWTSPIANLIQGKRPGATVEFTRRTTTVYKVGESARYESLLPRAENAFFALRTGDATIAGEDELQTAPAQAIVGVEVKPQWYEAKASFGLSDIIVLVDEPQRAAMALPFDKSVMIEGPPGSGKTSIGIMRIAVLYDQQWEALNLRQDRDAPFHDYSTMRVLVYNDEMVEYLKALAQSIGVERAQVETTTDFFRSVCQATGLLRGTRRRDPPSLAMLKGRREILAAYFAGFQRHLQSAWAAQAAELRRDLNQLAPDFVALADCIDRWVARVVKATVTDGRIVGSVGLADSLSDAHDDVIAGRSPTSGMTQQLRAGVSSSGDQIERARAALQARSKDAKKLVEGVVRSICDRAGATRAMFELPQYAALLEHLANDGLPVTAVAAGDRLWRKQYRGDLPAYSELDLAISTWLGAPLLLTRSSARKPWIGGKLQRLTHLVVDEAQDLSSSHIAVLAAQLVEAGTLTLVGDLHQNLNPYAGLRRWDEAGVTNAIRSAFGVNHRQTSQLGDFLAGLHTALFHEECPWTSSPRLSGAVPRAGTAQSWADRTAAIAAEVRHWRENIEGATIAVLYDGKLPSKRLRELRDDLEQALSDDLIPVEVAIPGQGADSLRRTKRVVIASVKQTKGLEFDVVVFIESTSRWSKPISEIDIRLRNGFYVATSRARAGLSLCMRTIPTFIEELADRGLCVVHSGTELASD